MRYFWLYKTFIESYFDNMLFNFLDSNCRLIDTKYTTAFAWRRANSSRKFGKVVGGIQNIIGFLPVLTVHRIIKFRYDITKRTTVVAKRNTTIHAPSSLLI